MAAILVIDDDPIVLTSLRDTLESAGHEVVTSSDPEQVPDLVEAHAIEAVVLDIQSPGVSDSGVLRTLREQPEVPVLVLCRAMDRVPEGAAGSLARPFTPEALTQSVERLLSPDAADPEPGEMLAPGSWCLLGLAADGREVWKTLVRRLPFHVGRQIDSDLLLPSHSVSSRHAALEMRQGSLWVRDLGSTNGTFVNGERVTGSRPVQSGDVLRFADEECRLIGGAGLQPTRLTQKLTLSGIDLLTHTTERQQKLQEMVHSDRLVAAFQPVVRLADETVAGYELLGRGELESREILPPELFGMVASMGLESELSSAFRTKGLEEAKALPGKPAVFVNTHPKELVMVAELVASLEALRVRYPDPELVLEIHESAVANPKTLLTLRSSLEDLGIGLAFDDFGTGQTRLLELIDVSPQYVKFDGTWIRDLHLAPRNKRAKVQTLVDLVKAWDIATVAEGIETPEEAGICSELGFEFAQGFYFGRPALAKSFT